jgi:hypothetical protein
MTAHVLTVPLSLDNEINYHPSVISAEQALS